MVTRNLIQCVPGDLTFLPDDVVPGTRFERTIKVKSHPQGVGLKAVECSVAESFLQTSAVLHSPREATLTLGMNALPGGELNIPVEVRCTLMDGTVCHRQVRLRGAISHQQQADPGGVAFTRASMAPRVVQVTPAPGPGDRLEICRGTGTLSAEMGGAGSLLISLMPGARLRAADGASVYVRYQNGSILSVPVFVSNVP